MNKKKIITLILSSVLILSLISGCSKTKSTTTNGENDTKVSTSETSTEKDKTKDDSNKKQDDAKSEVNKTQERTETQGISVIYPSEWIKKKIDGDDVYILDEKGANVNLVVESMQGLSEEQYNKVSDNDVKTNLHVNNIQVEEKTFNNQKARVTYYVQKSSKTNQDIPTYQVTFMNKNTSYIFTLGGFDKISDKSLQSFYDMLNTVEYVK